MLNIVHFFLLFVLVIFGYLICLMVELSTLFFVFFSTCVFDNLLIF